jgi:hypothetical protein
MATYRRPEILGHTLEAYSRMDAGELRWKLVLVDNAGDADTDEVAKRFRERLPLTFIVEARRGKNHALNAALPRAEGMLYVFSDDDAAPEPDWLAQIWSGARRWPDVTMFTGRVLPAWPPGHEPRDLRTDLLRSAYMVTAWGDEEGFVAPDKMRGANMAIRAELFRQGCRFDTSIGPAAGLYAMGSELELSLRLSREGHRGVYLPRAVVHHEIRPEQMGERWLAGRAYRSGLGVARLRGMPQAPRLFGMPRFVVKEVASHGLDWASGWLRRDERRRLDGKLEFWHWCGKLREYWRLRRAP